MTHLSKTRFEREYTVVAVSAATVVWERTCDDCPRSAARCASIAPPARGGSTLVERNCRSSGRVLYHCRPKR